MSEDPAVYGELRDSMPEGTHLLSQQIIESTYPRDELLSTSNPTALEANKNLRRLPKARVGNSHYEIHQFPLNLHNGDYFILVDETPIILGSDRNLNDSLRKLGNLGKKALDDLVSKNKTGIIRIQ